MKNLKLGIRYTQILSHHSIRYQLCDSGHVTEALLPYTSPPRNGYNGNILELSVN